jgi:hypothetical protein
MPYNTVPGIDDTTKAFPSVVTQAIADSDELQQKYARLEDGNLAVGDTVISTPGTPAALNTVGWCRAVFIAHGGTIPVDTPPYTLVIEADV